MDKVELLKKVRTLALRGVEGEQEQAKIMLDKLMKKYDVSEAELDDEYRETVKFKFHGPDDKMLLIYIAFKVTNNPNYIVYRNCSGRMNRTTVGIDCTEAERIQNLFLFDFYRELYKQEADFFLRAFIRKHQLFGHSELTEKVYLTAQEAAKMDALMRGMSDVLPTPRLEDQTGGHKK